MSVASIRKRFIKNKYTFTGQDEKTLENLVADGAAWNLKLPAGDELSVVLWHMNLAKFFEPVRRGLQIKATRDENHVDSREKHLAARQQHLAELERKTQIANNNREEAENYLKGAKKSEDAARGKSQAALNAQKEAIAEATNLEREALLARKLLIAQQAGKEIGSMNLLDDRVKKLTQRSAAIQSEEARVEKMIKGSTAALAKAERETLGAKSAADQANAKITELETQATAAEAAADAAKQRAQVARANLAKAQQEVARLPRLQFDIRGESLPKMDAGLFAKADPYVKIYAITSLGDGPDGEHGEVEIYKTETAKKTLNPKFKPFSLPQIICGTDMHAIIKLCFWDWDAVGGHDFIGHTEISLDMLISGEEIKQPLFNKEKKEKKRKKGEKYSNSGMCIVKCQVILPEKV